MNGTAQSSGEGEATQSACCKRQHEPDVEDEEDAEARHFAVIVSAFRFYKRYSLNGLKAKARSFAHLPPSHRQLLSPSFPSHLANLKACIETNSQLIPLILHDVGHLFENSDHEQDISEGSSVYESSEFNMEKLQSTLRQIARDWSLEGWEEREASYGPVIKAILEEFPVPSHSVRICIPGSGLGRLPWELARLGFTAQGNEFSLFMLFVSNFILNKSHGELSHRVYPYIHQASNHQSYEDIIRPVDFPDVDPCSLPKPSGLSMAAGDFLEVYEKETGEWDCVASVFFLDTARNPIQYIQLIYSMLKPGGVWINLGPLLYHYAEMADEDSIELPWTEVRRMIGELGFVMEVERFPVQSHYAHNKRSLLHHQYDCVFFVARKPRLSSPPQTHSHHQKDQTNNQTAPSSCDK